MKHQTRFKTLVILGFILVSIMCILNLLFIAALYRNFNEYLGLQNRRDDLQEKIMDEQFNLINQMIRRKEQTT